MKSKKTIRCRYNSHVDLTAEVACPFSNASCKEPCKWSIGRMKERHKSMVCRHFDNGRCMSFEVGTEYCKGRCRGYARK